MMIDFAKIPDPLLRCGVEVSTAKMMLNAVHHFGKGNY